MFCPWVKYEFPTKDDIDFTKNFLEKYKYYGKPVSLFNPLIKAFVTPIIDLGIVSNSLIYKLDENKDFENKCEEIFNLARFTIHNSIINKKETTHTKPNGFVQIPIKDINKCSGYNDFVSSLKNVDINLIKHDETKNDLTGIILYLLKSNNLIIMDEYKSNKLTI